MVTWALVLYFLNTTDIKIVKDKFTTLDECGMYYNTVYKDLAKIKDLSEIRCEEVGVIGKPEK